MGWNFRKRIRLMPGVAVNLSKGRPSVSLGGAPVTLNVGRGKKVTTSIPGTGLSHTHHLGSGKGSGGRAEVAGAPGGLREKVLGVLAVVAVFAILMWWFR